MARAIEFNQELDVIADMTTEQLRTRWEKLEGCTAPNVPPSILRHLLAQRLQERRLGGLSTLVARELERMVGGKAEHPSVRRRVRLTLGTRLIREWNGQTVIVDVLDEGFAFDDRTWRSLSEIARHVTGARWSGPRFFGLTGHA